VNYRSTKHHKLAIWPTYGFFDKAGSLPQFAGEHICSLKFKVWVIESWLRDYYSHSAALHAFGYNADETKRVAKSIAADEKRMAFGFNSEEPKRVQRARQYDSPTRTSIFPLVEWGWTREDCLTYLKDQFGIVWMKSACCFCPFNALKADAIERHKAHPEQVADALMLEHVSLSLNPRGMLYRDKSLIQITMASGNQPALNSFAQKLDASPWSLYRVRRVYKAKKGEDGRPQEDKKGQAIRAVEKLETFPGPAAARTELTRLAQRLGLAEESKGLISYVYVQRRAETYPAREDFYVAAPSVVETKARYGIPRFEEQWSAAQGNLF
jgi:hypothetical protein